MHLSRRSLLTHAIDGLMGSSEPPAPAVFDLAILPSLSRRQLGRLIPAITDASNVTIHGGAVVIGREPATAVVLFRLESPEAAVWPLVDGTTTIQTIADTLAAVWCEQPNAAFTRVRDVVLTLVRAGICVPRNPLS